MNQLFIRGLLDAILPADHFNGGGSIPVMDPSLPAASILWRPNYWTRPWCNYSACSLPYTCRSLIDGPLICYTSSNLWGNKGVDDLSLCCINVLGPGQIIKDVLFQELEDVDSLLHHPTDKDRFIGTRLSLPEVNHQHLRLAMLRVRLLYWQHSIRLSIFLLHIVTHYSSNNGCIFQTLGRLIDGIHNFLL